MSAWLVCPSVQSPSGSIRWRQTLWCRHRVTVVSGRRGPKTWYHKPPTPLRDAGTPVARHCHRDNYPHASLDACCRHRACGLWMHHGNAAGRGDGVVRRAPPAEGSWSRSDLRKRTKLNVSSMTSQLHVWSLSMALLPNLSMNLKITGNEDNKDLSCYKSFSIMSFIPDDTQCLIVVLSLTCVGFRSLFLKDFRNIQWINTICKKTNYRYRWKEEFILINKKITVVTWSRFF